MNPISLKLKHLPVTLGLTWKIELLMTKMYEKGK